MKIIDLTEKHKSSYFNCLEDWSDEMKERGNHKECWYESMKDKGLTVKLAVNDKGEVGGMIHYLPIEESFVQGKGLFFIPCIWVHGYKKGRGNFQKKGMGKALIQAAEEDVKAKGAKGISAWGLSLPFWMKASWFKKRGFRVADKNKMSILLWKSFTEDAEPPKWFQKRKSPQKTPGKVTVTAVVNGWCTVQSINAERAKRASVEFGEKVVFQEISTLDRNTFLEWGISDALYVDDKEISTGPPLTYKKIKKKISKKVKKLK